MLWIWLLSLPVPAKRDMLRNTLVHPNKERMTWESLYLWAHLEKGLSGNYAQCTHRTSLIWTPPLVKVFVNLYRTYMWKLSIYDVCLPFFDDDNELVASLPNASSTLYNCNLFSMHENELGFCWTSRWTIMQYNACVFSLLACSGCSLKIPRKKTKIKDI